MRMSKIIITSSWANSHHPVYQTYTHTAAQSSKTFFFFNDTATTEIYTLSLHDALPISLAAAGALLVTITLAGLTAWYVRLTRRDRKSTRLNSSHLVISYAVFCLKKKRHLVVVSFAPSHCSPVLL